MVATEFSKPLRGRRRVLANPRVATQPWAMSHNAFGVALCLEVIEA
jgi:hypothetical protein